MRDLYPVSTRSPVYDEIRAVVMYALTGRYVRSVHREEVLPGPQPHTLKTSTFCAEVCKEGAFWVSEKTHGERFVCVKRNGACYLVNRCMQVYTTCADDVSKCATLTATLGGVAAKSRVMKNTTVIDGELVRLPRGDPSSGEYRYFAFDAMMSNGELLISESYERRYSELSSAVADIPFAARKRAVSVAAVGWVLRGIERRGNAYFRVWRNDRGIVERAVPCDGLVFVANEGGYRAAIYKWKPRLHNTVDFAVQFCTRKAGMVNLQVCADRGERITVRSVEGSATVWGKFKDGDVVECAYDEARGTWVPLRARHDKHRPNYIGVFVATMEVLAENLSESRLVQLSSANTAAR